MRFAELAEPKNWADYSKNMKNKLVIANGINQCTVERHNIAISESLSNYHLGKITKGNENIFASVRLYSLKCHFFHT